LSRASPWFCLIDEMTEIAPEALATTRLAALDRLNGPFERYDFAGQQVFSNEILVGFPACRLQEIHDGYRDFHPSERTAGLKPPLPCDKSAV
jgi:hypothetical protein